jgi:hypothetical protein
MQPAQQQCRAVQCITVQHQCDMAGMQDAGVHCLALRHESRAAPWPEAEHKGVANRRMRPAML